MVKNIRFCVFASVALIGLSVAAFGQSASYKSGMKKCLAQFNSANSKAEFIKAAGSFETLALSEKTEWLPYYYAGLCDALGAFSSAKADIDALCDKGDKLAKTADSLSPQNSEVLVLKAMLAAARIPVDEKKRGQKYGGQVSKHANAAIKLNSANPRAYLLKGRALLYTPETFGGGVKKAKPVFETALEKFKTFKPESEFSPLWGKDEVEKELKAINDKPIK
jgi:hypothetical protein